MCENCSEHNKCQDIAPICEKCHIKKVLSPHALGTPVSNTKKWLCPNCDEEIILQAATDPCIYWG